MKTNAPWSEKLTILVVALLLAALWILPASADKNDGGGAHAAFLNHSGAADRSDSKDKNPPPVKNITPTVPIATGPTNENRAIAPGISNENRAIAPGISNQVGGSPPIVVGARFGWQGNTSQQPGFIQSTNPWTLRGTDKSRPDRNTDRQGSWNAPDTRNNQWHTYSGSGQTTAKTPVWVQPKRTLSKQNNNLPVQTYSQSTSWPRNGGSEKVIPSAKLTPAPKPDNGRPNAWFRNVQTNITQNNFANRDKRDTVKLPTLRQPDGSKVTPTIFSRTGNTLLNRSFTGLHKRFGDPSFGVAFQPRKVSDFSVGFRSGSDRGAFGMHFGSRHFDRDRDRDHDRVTFVFFFSSFYFDDPFFTGFSYPGYYPNMYYYYGWLPRWCDPPSLVVYTGDPYPVYYNPPTYYLQMPAMDVQGVNQTLSDIQQAWLNSDIDTLAAHLRQNDKLSVYFDNTYSYSLAADDYYSMTLDAMSTVRTQDLSFNHPTWINQNEVFVTGRHVFVDPDNQTQTVYLSFRLHQYSGGWYIIAVGSSPQPITNQYHDFRSNSSGYNNYGYNY